MDSGAWIGPKVFSSKEAETRAVLAAVKEGKEKGFETIPVWLVAKEVVQALSGDFDWAINPFVSYIENLILHFAHVVVY